MQTPIPVPPRGVLFVTGGAKSGKTRYALARAEAGEGPLCYIATATALDGEMAAKIAAHQAERGPRWTTREAPLDLPGALAGTERYCAVLIDCLTLWTTNLMMEHGEDDGAIEAAFDRLADALAGASAPVIVVTNEVGLGIVPMDRMARRFRNLAGALNQRVAALADEAVFVVSGRTLPLT